jgi:hypothetical protein
MKNKLSKMGILSLALVFGMLLFVGCPEDGGNNTGGENPSGENPAGETPSGDNPAGETPGGDTTGKNITVSLKKPASWSQVYAYVWDDNGNEYTQANSGTQLSESSGFYSYKASTQYGYVNARFTDGASNSTMDILDVEADTYYQAASYSSGSTLLLNESSNGTFTTTTPQFKASEVTDSTVTLTWTPIPEADGYVLYDEFVEFDDNDEEKPGSEYWHFQKALSQDDTSLYDDNYGAYLEPEMTYTWKLVAVKYKENASYTAIGAMDPDDVNEAVYAPLYTVVYDFGKLEVETKTSSLSTPTGLTVVSTGATNVKLKWNAVSGADYYMVWWRDNNGDDDEWYYIEEAYTNEYEDIDEEFIEPASSYSYLIVAHNERTYSNDSTEVTAQTSSSVASNLANRSIARAANAPTVPQSVNALPTTTAESFSVSWQSQGTGIGYYVGISKTATGTPVWTSVKLPNASKTFTSADVKKIVKALGGQLDFYVRVYAFSTSKSSVKTDWSTGVPCVVFPTGMGFASSLVKSTKNKTVGFTMKNVWTGKLQTGEWTYGYDITYTDTNTNKTGEAKNTYTGTFDNVPATSKAKATAKAYIQKGYGTKYIFATTFTK